MKGKYPTIGNPNGPGGIPFGLFKYQYNISTKTTASMVTTFTCDNTFKRV